MRNKITLKWLALSFIFISSSAFAEKDPYADIEHLKLENGLEVFLAHSKTASQVEVKVEVDTGINAEERHNWGVAHLLEHVLFRDKGLQDEMTYLQIIRENGGSANGSTKGRITDYFGTIPAKKGTWLLESFTKMLLQPVITAEYVEKEKGTVELERGRPDPISKLLGFSPRQLLNPSYLEQPGFWMSEFKADFDDPYTLVQEQIATQKLSLKHVKDFYTDYYYPSNMRVFVAGNFDRAEIMNVINNNWGKLPAREGKKLAPVPTYKARLSPYIRTNQSNGTPYVSFGTKLHNTTIQETEIIEAYMSYLSHRLMKEIRNKMGQTYSASAKTYTYYGSGYSYIGMQAPQERFYENLKMLQDFLSKEATNGALTDEQVAEAKKLYLDQYALIGNESGDRMNMIDAYHWTLENHGQFISPYKVLSEATTEDFNKALKKHFVPHMEYSSLSAPPLFFHYDYFLFGFIFSALLFMGVRGLLTKDFAHDKVKWIRNVRYPPVKSLELLLVLVVGFVFTHINYVAVSLMESSNFWQSSLFLAEFMRLAIWIGNLLLAAQVVMSLVPKKLMVMDRFLVIKSLSYYSKHIPLDAIASVESVRLLGYPFPLSRWFGRVRFRLYKFDFAFWRKGLLVNLKDGRSYFFSVSDADKARAELLGFVPSSDEKLALIQAA